MTGLWHDYEARNGSHILVSDTVLVTLPNIKIFLPHMEEWVVTRSSKHTRVCMHTHEVYWYVCVLSWLHPHLIAWYMSAHEQVASIHESDIIVHVVLATEYVWFLSGWGTCTCTGIDRRTKWHFLVKAKSQSVGCYWPEVPCDLTVACVGTPFIRIVSTTMYMYTFRSPF